MAAIYDELGNVIGDDGALSLDQMKLELVRNNKPLSSQIPGYNRPIPPAQTPPAANPLEAAAGNFTSLATNFNPLMMAKSMREAAGMLTVPPVAAIKGVGESIFASPEGTYTSGKAPDYAEKVAKQFMEQNAPQTPLTQAFGSAIAPYMADLPVYLGHLSTGRPALTPNDVRVMGAEATRLGRQVRDIPTDFSNAQAGLQKIDPITGQPTMGSRLGQADRSVTQAGMQFEKTLDPIVQDIMAKGGTSADLLAAMAGQPMYAMRPAGSRIQNAVLPPTAKPGAASYTPVDDILRDVVTTDALTPAQVLDEIQSKVLRPSHDTLPVRKAFENFLQQKANEMYPDAPSPEDALAAYKLKFGDRAASATTSLAFYDEFLNTPEGIQFRAALNLPSSDEVAARHEAASQWLRSQFANYINEKVGTPDEPAAKLASRGLTFVKPEDVFDSAEFRTGSVEAKRTQAGMPAKTAIDQAKLEAERKLQELTAASAAAENKKREQQAAAINLGYGAIDPNTGRVAEGMNMGRYEPFAQASREAAKAAAALAKQQQKYDNLRLGSAYEQATDRAINASTAKDLKNDLEYREQQFYPSLLRTPEDQLVYTASAGQLRNLGFDTLASTFYNDVMSGAIPLDKVPKMTVENYIRQVAEKRIADERLAKEQEAKYISDVNNKFKESADKYIPLDKTYRNVGALEITNKIKPEEVGRLASEITLALDVCIGEGGSAVDTPNYWQPNTGNRQYVPIYDILTGEKNPKATSPRMTFINAVKKGDQMIDFRDLATGVPAAVFQFEKLGPKKFHVGFASGHRNHYVQPQYVDGIKDYLNSRSDDIASTSHNLAQNLSIYDRNSTGIPTLAQAANVPTSDFRRLDLSSLPRFVTSRDLQEFVSNYSTPPAQTPVSTIANQQPSQSLEAYAIGAASSAIDNVLDEQRRRLTDRGEESYIPVAEQFFEDIRAYFNAYLGEQGPARALELTTARLLSLEPEYANSARRAANIIADGMTDLMHTLGLQAEYVQNRMAAEAARQQPRAVAQQGEPMPTMSADQLLLNYSDRLTPEQQQYLREFRQRWENTNYPDDLSVEFAHWRAENRLAPEGRPDYLRMTQNAALGLDLQWGVDAGDEMRAIIRTITDRYGLDPAENTEAFISGLRREAENADRGTVEIALNELADRMESEYMRDWEPEVTHPANAPVPAQRQSLTQMSLEQLGQEVYQLNAETAGGVFGRVNDAINRRVNAATRQGLDPTLEANDIRQGLGLTNDITPLEREYIARIVEIRLNGGGLPAPPAPAEPQNVVPRGDDVDPEELRNAFLSGARTRLDDVNYNIVESHVNGIAEYLNSRDEPEEFASMVREVAEGMGDINARDLLRSYANQIEDLYGPPTRAQQPANQEQMQAMGQAIDNVLMRQLQRLRDQGNNRAADIFVATYPVLVRENGLEGMLLGESNPADFGRALQGFRNDLNDQISSLQVGSDQHRAAALAMANVVEVINSYLPYLNERITAEQTETALMQEIRQILDNAELDPDDLRSIASDMQPFSDNQHWRGLSEQTRNTAIRQLNERANYIEFSPADFAIRLSNEAGANIPDLRDTVQALNDGTFDHEILRGLPAIERDSASQRTALHLNHILQGMEADAPPTEEAAPTRRQQRMLERVPQITDMLIDFSTDDPINTTADYRRVAALLRNPDTALGTVQSVMAIGDSIGDFTLRASDLRNSTLRLVADELESRANEMDMEADFDRLREIRYSAENIVETLSDRYYEQQNNARSAIRLMQQDMRSLRRNGEMALTRLLGDDEARAYNWSPDLLNALEIAYEDMIEQYRQRGIDAGEQGLANGGPVRGYKEGGSVTDNVQTPSLFSVQDYSNFTAKDMYPGKVGIDDQRDAARHMLAAGTLARKYNPWVAEKLGQAYEFKSAPLQHIKSWFGGDMPPNYYMDMHNNTVGARLGSQARSQSELEDLVQAEAEKASKVKTPGRAFILKSDGGIVQQNPTTDQMRYELMMRRK